MAVLQFLFLDHATLLARAAPLTYRMLIDEVLLPEIIEHLVCEDLKVTAAAAKAINCAFQLFFGQPLHKDVDSCPALEEVQRYIMRQSRSPAYRIWSASGTTLDRDSWRSLQVVKSEPVEPEIPGPGSHSTSVIDLTLNDDE